MAPLSTQHGVCLHPLAPPPAVQDPALAWCAANFMEQKHPLVAALRARVSGGAGVLWMTWRSLLWVSAVCGVSRGRMYTPVLVTSTCISAFRSAVCAGSPGRGAAPAAACLPHRDGRLVGRRQGKFAATCKHAWSLGFVCVVRTVECQKPHHSLRACGPCRQPSGACGMPPRPPTLPACSVTFAISCGRASRQCARCETWARCAAAHCTHHPMVSCRA